MRKIFLILITLLALPLFGCQNDEYLLYAGSYNLDKVVIDNQVVENSSAFEYFTIELYASGNMSIRSKGAKNDSTFNIIAYEYDGAFTIKNDKISFLTKKYDTIEEHDIIVSYEGEVITDIYIVLKVAKNIELDIIHDFEVTLKLFK